MSEPVADSLIPLRLAALGGIMWNAFGVFQFSLSSFSSAETLIGMGMTQAQVAVYAGLPVWMPVVFGIGSIGGLIGSILLLIRRRLAVPALLISLFGYTALFLGDWLLGVFAAFGLTQVITLCLVLAIAVALLWGARRWAARGVLR